jgi:hypothetical protein
MTGQAEAWAIAALAGTITLAGAVVWLALRVRTLVRRLAVVTGDPRLLERVERLAQDVEMVGRRLEHVAGRVERLGVQAHRGLQRVGLVRYDAFGDMGGHLSFSVALLDAERNGLVLSVLNGRDGARAYAKPVQAGASPVVLSDEERQAIAQA